MDLSDVGAKGD